LIRVYRQTVSKLKTTEEVAYFISSLSALTSAKTFNEGVRSHWSVESFHYTKDVTFKEDAWKVKLKNAPANYSLIRNLALNVFRKNNLNNIQETLERCTNNVSFMMSLF